MTYLTILLSLTALSAVVHFLPSLFDAVVSLVFIIASIVIVGALVLAMFNPLALAALVLICIGGVLNK